MVPLSWYLGLSAMLFTIGAVGVFIKRNAITIFLCIELMLNAVNLTLVSLSGFFGDVGGQLFVFIVMTVAAAEAAVRHSARQASRRSRPWAGRPARSQQPELPPWPVQPVR